MKVKGRCLCGQIQYQLSVPPSDVACCHCSQCRRTLGSAFAAYARTETDSFQWLTGAKELSRFESAAGVNRCFCPNCGSQLGVIVGDGNRLNWITLGSVDGDPGVRPEAHIFVGSKAPWHEIEDDLPQFDEWPGEASEYFGRFC